MTTTQPLTFSVIVPTVMRHQLLEGLLRSVAGQCYPVSEVIIVDQTPQPANQENLAACLVNEPPIALCYLHAPIVNGAAQARNYGGTIAIGNIVLFLDDDVTLDSEFTLRLAHAFEDPTVAGATGMIVDTHNPRPSAFYRLLFRAFFIGEFRQVRQEIWWSGKKGIMRTNTLPGVVAYRRDIWREYQFDETFTGHSTGEDTELSYRIGKHWKLVIDTRTYCLHDPAPATYKTARSLMANTLLFYHYHFRKNMRGTLSQWFQLLWIIIGYVLRGVIRRDTRQLLGILDGWRGIMERGIIYRPESTYTIPSPDSNFV